VKTFARVATDLPAAKLLIVGKPIFNNDHEYEAEIVKTIASLGLRDRAILTGQRDDALNVIAQLDTLVINSKSEAFVMVAIEAMAAGTPVIATDVGGTAEMIRHRFNGWLVDPGVEKQLEEALVTLYNNDLQRRLFSRRSKEIVADRLNEKRFIREFEAVLMSDGEQATTPAVEQAVSLSV
jgi:glycosyltransferase involved in cell wall biosynthesis